MIRAHLTLRRTKSSKWLLATDLLFAVGALGDTILSYLRTFATDDLLLGIAVCAVATKILWCWSSIVGVLATSLAPQSMFSMPSEDGSFPVALRADGAFPTSIKTAAPYGGDDVV